MAGIGALFLRSQTGFFHAIFLKGSAIELSSEFFNSIGPCLRVRLCQSHKQSPTLAQYLYTGSPNAFCPPAWKVVQIGSA